MLTGQFCETLRHRKQMVPQGFISADPPPRHKHARLCARVGIRPHIPPMEENTQVHPFICGPDRPEARLSNIKLNRRELKGKDA